MHPLQYIAIALMVIIGATLVAAAFLGLFMAVFPNAIKYKPDSRLIRWPKATKRFMLTVRDDFANIFFAISVFFDPALAERVLRDIETGQPELPLEA
jgi:hypothetical protein